MTKKKRTQKRNWILPDEPFPLYQLERRKLKWASTPERAKRALRRIFFIPLILLLVIWFLTVYFDSHSPSYYSDWHWQYIVFVFGGSLTLLSFLLDFASMVVTFGSMGNEKVLKRWDLLVLAAEKDQIARSKHAFARLRITRVLTFNLSVRVAVVVIAILTLTISGYFIDGAPSIETWVRDLQYTSFSSAVGVIVLVILLFAFYLLEPIWRVSAITAMGVALSARVSRVVLLVPLAFLLLVLVWILQGLALSAITYSLLWMANLIDSIHLNITGDYYMPDWLASIGVITSALIYLFATYAFYIVLILVAYNRIKARIP